MSTFCTIKLYFYRLRGRKCNGWGENMKLDVVKSIITCNELCRKITIILSNEGLCWFYTINKECYHYPLCNLDQIANKYIYAFEALCSIVGIIKGDASFTLTELKLSIPWHIIFWVEMKMLCIRGVKKHHHIFIFQKAQLYYNTIFDTWSRSI